MKVTNKEEFQAIVNRNWFQQFSEDHPDGLAFAEAIAKVRPEAELFYAPSYPYLLGVVQSTVTELLAEIRRLKTERHE